MRRKSAGSARSAADLHRAWLELVDADGPFLSVPALKRVWPQYWREKPVLLTVAKK